MKKSQFTIEKKTGFLQLTITGEYDKNEFIAYPKMVATACKKEGVNKVLVNALNLSGTNVPTIDRFNMGETIATLLGPKIKLAIVWPKEHINKLTETVALNRGGRINVVSDMETAQNWLLGTSSCLVITFILSF